MTSVAREVIELLISSSLQRGLGLLQIFVLLTLSVVSCCEDLDSELFNTADEEDKLLAGIGAVVVEHGETGLAVSVLLLVAAAAEAEEGWNN